MLGVADAATAVIALVALLITRAPTHGRAGDDRPRDRVTRPRPSSPTAAGFIEAVCFVPAQTMIVLGISYPATPVISAAARLIEPV